MTTLQHDAVRAWDAPTGIAPRGTVIVLPGRGETPEVYERLGARLSFDGYQVRAVGDATTDEEAVAATVAGLLTDGSLAAPRVLAGSDAGALFAILLAARHRGAVDGLVLAGLPVDGNRADLDWTAELTARTACPTHQKRLSGGVVAPGALDREVPAHWLAAADLAALDVPVLGLHGEDDTVSPVDAARSAYARAARATLVTVAGGRHDALNDATHRTAAATTVLFLERLRLGADLPVIARTASRS